MVEAVNFGCPTFSTDQVTAILTMLSEGPQGKLERLKVIFPDFGDEALSKKID